MSVRRSLAWSYGGQFLNFFVSFGGSVVIARLLTPHQMGVFAVAMAYTAILTILTSFSIAAYTVRERELSREVLRPIFTVNAVMGVVLAIATFAFGWIGTRAMHSAEVGDVLRLLSLTPLIGIFEFVPSTLMVREMNFRVLTIIGAARALITTTTTITAALMGLGAMSPATGPIVGAAFAAAAASWIRRKDLIFRPTFRGVRPIVTFGLQIMSISGVAQIASKLSELILGRMLGLAALGLWSRAGSLASLMFDSIYGMATRVLFSKLSEDLRERGSLHETYIKSLRLLTAIMWPMMIGLAVLSRPAVHILYGDRWLGAALPLSLLMIAQFVVLSFGMNWELFVLRHETALQTRFEFIRAGVMLATFTAGCFFNLAGAAVGRVVEAVVGYLLYRPHMDRVAGTEPGEMERVYLDSLLLTGAAVAPSLLLMLATRFAPDTSPLLIVPAVIVGILLWFATLIARDHPLLGEMRLGLALVRRPDRRRASST